MSDSRKVAQDRLNSLCRNLERDSQLNMQYKACIKEYLSLGHMTKVEEITESIGSLCYYLPYYAVLKENSATTKLRTVFDGSCKISTGKSLNDILRVVPTRIISRIQQELFSIILRFRQHQFVLTGDIEKIYRQINMQKEHRGLQRV